MTDARTYIRLHDGMPDHPKIDALSDRAFRLLITSWCWCSRHLTDGHIPAATWRKRGTPAARAELVAAGLVEQHRDGVRMHDYLEHQRSAAAVEQIRHARGQGGSLGNHIRWHVRQGVNRAGCPHCEPEPHPARALRSRRSRNGKVIRGPREGQPSDYRETSPVDSDVHFPADIAPTSADDPASASDPAPGRSQDRSQSDRKTSPETQTETYIEDLRSSLQGSVDHHRSDRYARTRAREEPYPHGPTVAAELRALTGREVSPDHASAVARLILRGRQVSDPRAYLAAALRADPAAFLPTSGDPSRRTLTEAITDALASQPCPHGATGPERCPMCRRAPTAPPGGPSATSISDETRSSPRTSDQGDGPPDGQPPNPPNPEDARAEPGPGGEPS